ncbi:MAG: MarR family transcriptional regulator [Desulfobacteraceae bacterium]|jgi:DNA-binding MarR family transcriptional regulator
MTNTSSITSECEELVDLFRRASKLMARAYHRRAHAHHAQGHVFSIIKEHGSIKQRELLELLDVRSSSLSEVLGKLERNGLIVRKKDEDDKRGFIVSVNENADSLFQQKDEFQQDANALFAGLQKDEQQQLAALLNKVIHSLEKESLCWKASHDGCKHGGKYRRYGRRGHTGHRRHKNHP